MTASLVYVYAILSEPAPVAVTGVDDTPVRWLTEDGLTAAVSDVPASEFEEAPLNQNIGDMGWLGPRAVAHQDVNARLFDASEAILPLAFGTVFRDDEGVRGLLRNRSAPLGSQLRRVAGCAEWVVALHLLRQPDAEEVAAASPRIQQLQGEIASASPGRAHLLRQQLQALERDESRRVQAEAGTRLFDAVGAVAVDVYREPLPLDAVDKPLLRASVLVRRNAETEFMDEVDRLRSQWPEPTYRLMLTGPWPPYRFGGLSPDA